MEKKCIIIMPVSDPVGYAPGHFKRVYDYIVAPACRMAGFWPTRADDPAANDKALDIIKNITDSDIAICDLSSNNSNSLYGMAIRQALNLPLILIKDMKTQIMSDTQEFSEVEYDESLRIDTVQKEVETLRETMEKIYAGKGDKNSLLSRFGIGPGRLPQPPIVLIETDVISKDEPVEPEPVEPAAPKEKHLPVISPLPGFVGNPITDVEIEKLKVGDFLFHMNYGKGEIKTVRKIAKDKMAEVLFESGSKTLVLGTSGILRKINA